MTECSNGLPGEVKEEVAICHNWYFPFHMMDEVMKILTRTIGPEGNPYADHYDVQT
jgi:hypothetical protein